MKPASTASTLLSLLAVLSGCASGNTDHQESHEFSDTLRLYYVGYPIGTEVVSASVRDDGGVSYGSEQDWSDRGRRSQLSTTLDLDGDFQPLRLEVATVSDGSRDVRTLVEFENGTATVRSGGASESVPIPPGTFPIDGIRPVSPYLPLVLHWRRLGRPAAVPIVPGLPVDSVQIAARGQDTLRIDGVVTVLDRYSVSDVVWGREAVWIDQEGRLGAFSSGGGGGLTTEAVRTDLEPAFAQLQSSATADRMADLASLGASVSTVASGASSRPLALVGATVVDGTGAPPIPNATVLIAHGHILAVGPSVPVPESAERIDLDGRVIVPGLWDMHAHAMQIEWAPVYLAAGVTTVRDMGNTLPFVVPFRDALLEETALGPRLLLAGLIDGGGPDAFGAINAATPEEGRATVRQYRQYGFEQMKLYTLLTPQVVEAIADEAHTLGMSVTGHVPRALTVREGVEAGMDHIAHLPIRGDVTSDSVVRLISYLAGRGTVLDPIASWGELLRRSRDEPISTFQPGIERLPPALYRRVSRLGADVDTATAHEQLRRTLSIIKALHDAGVPVVAGTDEGVPGFSVYREVELYVQAGMSPMDALRAATAVGAEAMGMLDEVGTIEVGKRGDLLILDANPLDDISNIRTGRWVVRGGMMYRTEDIWEAVGFRTGPSGLAPDP